MSDELAIIYLARDLSFGQASPEETEQLAIRKIPFSQAFNMVLNGEIMDSMSVAAILKVNALNIVA